MSEIHPESYHMGYYCVGMLRDHWDVSSKTIQDTKKMGYCFVDVIRNQISGFSKL